MEHQMRSAVRLVLVFAATQCGSFIGSAQARQNPTPLTTIPIATNIPRPIFLCSPPGDVARLFVMEQWSGQVKIIKDGAVLPQPFLDMSGLIATGDDQGVRAMAFHPSY